MFRKNKNSSTTSLIGTPFSPSNNPFITRSIFSKTRSKGPFNDIFCITDDIVKICIPTTIKSTLDIEGDVSIGTQESPKDLIVSGKIIVDRLELLEGFDFSSGISTIGSISGGSLQISGSSNLSGNLNVTGNSTLNQLEVSGISSFTGQASFENLNVVNLTEMNNATVNVLDVLGQTNLKNVETLSINNLNQITSGSIVNNGTSTVFGDVENRSNTSTNTLTVLNDSNLSIVNVENNLNTPNATITTAQIGGLTVSNNASFVQNVEMSSLQVSGSVNNQSQTQTNTLRVVNESELLGNVSVGTTSVPANMNVSGILSTKTLQVVDPIDFSAGVSTTGNVSIGGTLQVDGDSTFSSDINSQATLSTNNLTVASSSQMMSTTIDTLQVNGSTTVSDVTSSVINNNGSLITGALNVSTTSSFNGDISIGTTEIPANADVSGVLTTKTLQVTDPINVNGLTVSGATQLNGALTVVSDSNLNNVTLNNLTANGLVNFQANVDFNGGITSSILNVTGTSNFQDIIANNIQLQGSLPSILQNVNTTNIMNTNDISTSNITVGASSTLQGIVTATSGINTSTLSVTNNISAGGIIFTPQELDDIDPIVLGAKKTIIIRNGAIDGNLVIDDTTPEYHEFKILNKSIGIPVSISIDLSQLSTFDSSLSQIFLRKLDGTAIQDVNISSVNLQFQDRTLTDFMCYFEPTQGSPDTAVNVVLQTGNSNNFLVN